MFIFAKIKFIVMIALLSFSTIFSQQMKPQATGPDSTVVNINEWELWVKNNGSIPPIGKDKNAGYYPQGVNAIWWDNIVFGGMIYDKQEPVLRVGGNSYLPGMKPGKVLYENGKVVGSESQENQQIWRVRPDYKTEDLSKDAASTLMKDESQVDSTDLQAVYDQYDYDWQNWPAEKGAPFVDNNNNGTYEPDFDIPGNANALQTVWLVANDLPLMDGAEISANAFGSPPIGIELQMTVWATNEPTELAVDHAIFKEIKLIYTGTTETNNDATIDTMYITNFVDGDLGFRINDRAGYDSTLSLGYFYNGEQDDEVYSNYGINPPSIGYSFVETPKIDGTEVPMSAFWAKFVGGSPDSDPDLGEYSGTRQMFNIMEGYRPRPEYPEREPWLEPPAFTPTKFTYSGNPITGSGWVDGDYYSGRGERRFWMSCGPFSMALGDTQKVAIAIVGGNSSDYLNSITVMKYNALGIRWAYRNWVLDTKEEDIVPSKFSLSQNYPNPFNPSTTIKYDLPSDSNVEITVYNLLGEKITTLINSSQSAGTHEIIWNGTNDFGRTVSAGIYIYQIRAGDISDSRKMLLIK